MASTTSLNSIAPSKVPTPAIQQNQSILLRSLRGIFDSIRKASNIQNNNLVYIPSSGLIEYIRLISNEATERIQAIVDLITAKASIINPSQGNSHEVSAPDYELILQYVKSTLHLSASEEVNTENLSGISPDAQTNEENGSNSSNVMTLLQNVKISVYRNKIRNGNIARVSFFETSVIAFVYHLLGRKPGSAMLPTTNWKDGVKETEVLLQTMANDLTSLRVSKSTSSIPQKSSVLTAAAERNLRLLARPSLDIREDIRISHDSLNSHEFLQQSNVLNIPRIKVAVNRTINRFVDAINTNIPHISTSRLQSSILSLMQYLTIHENSQIQKVLMKNIYSHLNLEIMSSIAYAMDRRFVVPKTSYTGNTVKCVLDSICYEIDTKAAVLDKDNTKMLSSEEKLILSSSNESYISMLGTRLFDSLLHEDSLSLLNSRRNSNPANDIKMAALFQERDISFLYGILLSCSRAYHQQKKLRCWDQYHEPESICQAISLAASMGYDSLCILCVAYIYIEVDYFQLMLQYSKPDKLSQIPELADNGKFNRRKNKLGSPLDLILWYDQVFSPNSKITSILLLNTSSNAGLLSTDNKFSSLQLYFNGCIRDDDKNKIDKGKERSPPINSKVDYDLISRKYDALKAKADVSKKEVHDVMSKTEEKLVQVMSPRLNIYLIYFF